MSTANRNWPRWIFASMSKHFADAAANNLAKDGITPEPINFYVEGNERDIVPGSLEYFEFRFDGPYILEVSKDYWRVNIEVNVLAVAKRNDKDFHRIHTLCGLVVAAFTTNISIFKYGTGVEDDQSILTCLTLTNEFGENLGVQHLGQLNPDFPEAQATIEGYYQGFIET